MTQSSKRRFRRHDICDAVGKELGQEVFAFRDPDKPGAHVFAVSFPRTGRSGTETLGLVISNERVRTGEFDGVVAEIVDGLRHMIGRHGAPHVDTSSTIGRE